ncbi:MAG: TOTE conflict system archaeo-eukaryotic primase domain-containing protein [Terriglobia bacterium]
MRSLRLNTSASVVADYFHLFVNRRAYTLQSNRPHPEGSRHYYYRPKDKKTGQGLSLTLDTIRRHLEGEITIGLYAINPATQCSKWVAIDADYENARTDLLKLNFYLKQEGVESAFEKSRRGGHLWIFMAEGLPARDCRMYVCGLAGQLGISVKSSRKEGVEIFPKHDALKPGRYGNAIRGPLGVHRGASQRFWFDGADEDLENQMCYLNSLPKMTGNQLARLIAGKPIPPQLLPPEPKPERVVRLHMGASEFRILDHIDTKLRTVGHNNVTRCPSCAEDGHDRSGDNLSISIEDPRKYICWAGCTSDMIRSALGCPRVYVHVQNKEASNVEVWPDSNRLTGGEIPRRGTQSDGLRG